MDRKILIAIRPIIRDKLAWDAFLEILAYQESKVVAKLNGPKLAEDLIRINAEYNLLQTLKKIKDIADMAENEFRPKQPN